MGEHDVEQMGMHGGENTVVELSMGQPYEKKKRTDWDAVLYWVGYKNCAKTPEANGRMKRMIHNYTAYLVKGGQHL